MLISPAYALFDRVPDAYAAVKTINSLVMSLAAVPAYFIARRVVGKWLALLAALLAVAVPSMVYTATVMTENAYYPLFLLAALALVALLERPTCADATSRSSPRSALAYLTRSQAVVIAAAAVDGAAPARPLPARSAAGDALGRTAGCTRSSSAGAVARRRRRRSPAGRPLSALLGAYAVVGEASYDVGTAAALRRLPPRRSSTSTSA